MVSDKLTMNDKLQRRDMVFILGINSKEYGDAEGRTNWGKAICLRIEGMAKTVWIPKSSFKIMSSATIDATNYHSERKHYVVEVDEWWRNKYSWLFKRPVVN